MLNNLRSTGVAVLLNSHLLSEVELVCDRVVIIRGGVVVTEGAPHDLSRPRGVRVETDAGSRIVSDVTRDGVPALVAQLVADGEKVYAVTPLQSTLEEVYLEAVGGDTA